MNRIAAKIKIFFALIGGIWILLVFPVFANSELPSPPQEQQFFQSLDIPLMPGLLEVNDATVIFDKPNGRIIESKAVSKTLTAKQIHEFYETTLPQMGWTKISSQSFVRQEEILTIDIQTQDHVSTVAFMVAPRS